tara:strand:- start:306 stop:1733 length:1428 start_codon:yes stop_codon:yes gene_type:complete
MRIQINFTESLKSNFFYLFIFIILIICFKLLYYVPDIENGGDAVKYYKIGIEVSNYNFSNFLDHHFYLRWGVWVNSLISNILLPNNILSYYLSNLIPFWIGITIFSKILFRETGLISSIFFLLILSSDPDLTRASYQLLPMGSAILPLALLTNSTIKNFKKLHDISNLKILYISFLCYWLFSIRETFLLFILIYLIFFIKLKLLKKLNMFILSFFLFYIVETIIFKLMYSDFSLLGKLYFFLNDSNELSKVWFEKTNLSEFIDNGLFSRWYKGSLLGSQSVIFFISFILSILEIFKKKNLNDMISISKILSYFILLFFILNTLFVVSLNPLMPGLPHDSRFVAPIIPLCLMLIIIYVNKNLDVKNLFSLIFFIFLLFNFISINIYKQLWNYKYYEFKYSSLNKKINFYNNFSNILKNNNCIMSEFSKRLTYHLEILHEFDTKNHFTKFKNKKILKNGKNFVIKSDDKKCMKKVVF